MIYFDNAATTFPKPENVYSFMDKFYREYGVNVGRGQHELSDRASSLVAETRKQMLELFHCPNRQVVFTPSATEALNVVLQGLCWQDGQKVYITPFEHNSVLRVLHHIGEIHNIEVIELSVDKVTLEYNLEEIRYQFQDNAPNVVIMNHASNVNGVIAPIKEICDLSKKYDATTVVDMAQTAGLIDIDLCDTLVDFAIFAGHKTLYATFGIAGFITYKNTSIAPLLYGGTGVDSANPELPVELPSRFEVGSLNIAAIAGLNAALKWIDGISIARLREAEQKISEELMRTLQKHENIKLILSGNNHVGVISCNFDGYSADAIGQVLSDKNIAVRTGLHCAPAAHKFLGTFPSGTVRFSVSYFNNSEDIVALEEVLGYIQENS